MFVRVSVCVCVCVFVFFVCLHVCDSVSVYLAAAFKGALGDGVRIYFPTCILVGTDECPPMVREGVSRCKATVHSNSVQMAPFITPTLL